MNSEKQPFRQKKVNKNIYSTVLWLHKSAQPLTDTKKSMICL